MCSPDVPFLLVNRLCKSEVVTYSSHMRKQDLEVGFFFNINEDTGNMLLI